MADIHQGARSEHLAVANADGVAFHSARIIHGRDSQAYGLHAGVFSHFLNGINRGDFLQHLGFRPTNNCPFSGHGESYCLEVSEDFDLEAFAVAFAAAYTSLREADQHLDRCGVFISARDFPARRWADTRGDGHTGSEHARHRETDDANFQFVFTSLTVPGEGTGWTTHYRAKEQPISSEMADVFDFLNIKPHEECAEFDFEQCYWRFTRREARDRLDFGNNQTAFDWFDHHTADFSPGIERLLNSDMLVRPFEMHVIPRRARQRVAPRAAQRPVAPQPRGAAQPVTVVSEVEDDFDVAVSFAGPQRALAEELATILTDRGVRVFYDRFHQAQLWGKNLVEYFDTIYRRRARFCVMFVSEAYRDGLWTTHERRSALDRAVEDRGREYILPIKVEDVDLDGIHAATGYLPIGDYTIEQIAEMVIEKLNG